MKKDIDYDTELAYIENKVKELADLLSDTRLKAGSEAMNAAVSIYNFIKQASNNNVAGARSAYEMLKPRFEVTRRSKKEPKPKAHEHKAEKAPVAKKAVKKHKE